MKILTLKFEFDEDEWQEFLDHDLVQGNVNEFVFAEFCQNQGMGMLTECSAETVMGDNQ